MFRSVKDTSLGSTQSGRGRVLGEMPNPQAGGLHFLGQHHP